jgi:hypothetical protein
MAEHSITKITLAVVLHHMARDRTRSSRTRFLIRLPNVSIYGAISVNGSVMAALKLGRALARSHQARTRGRLQSNIGREG